MAKKKKERKKDVYKTLFCVCHYFICLILYALCFFFFIIFQSLCDDQKKKEKSGFYRAFFVSFVTVLVVQPPLCIRWRNKHVSFFFTQNCITSSHQYPCESTPFFLFISFHTHHVFFSFFILFFHFTAEPLVQASVRPYTLPLSCFFFFLLE